LCEAAFLLNQFVVNCSCGPAEPRNWWGLTEAGATVTLSGAATGLPFCEEEDLIARASAMMWLF
jgi:hypothetical protein